MTDPLAVGSLFAGEYRILRRLSEGGMGTVFVAEQISTGRERALKVMQRHLVADDRAHTRFIQEARISGHLDSDHVVAVVGAGVDRASGVPWIAMELLLGEDLATAAARRSFEPDEVLALFAQLCHGLGAAHRANIVHRDLKPENVFLARPKRAGDRFDVKVLDFGIAKVIANASKHATQCIGTPLWMAPEQASVGGEIPRDGRLGVGPPCIPAARWLVLLALGRPR